MTGTLHDPWPDVFDLRTISLFNGSPNAGKTALLAAMLQRLNTGGDLFGIAVPATPVFFIASDRLWDSGAATWFDRQGFDIPHYSFVDDTEVPVDSILAKYPWQVYLDGLEGLRKDGRIAPGYIICNDPFTNAFGDVMDRRKVIAGSWAIQRYLKEHNLFQLGVMHSAKMKGDAGLNYANVHEQMAGSGALSGYSSAQLTLLAPKQTGQKDGLYHLHVTSHSLPGMIFGLSRDSDGLFLIDQYIRLDEAAAMRDTTDHQTAPPTPLRPDHAAILRCISATADTPTSTEMIHASCSDQLPTRTIERILTDLRKAGFVTRLTKGWYLQTAQAKVVLGDG